MAINFEKYHEDNPQIWEKFIHYARLTKNKGFKHYSANGIFELIRWHTGVKGTGAFKINNVYRPDYARKLMADMPEEFADFFRLRKTNAVRIRKDDTKEVLVHFVTKPSKKMRVPKHESTMDYLCKELGITGFTYFEPLPPSIKSDEE